MYTGRGYLSTGLFDMFSQLLLNYFSFTYAGVAFLPSFASISLSLAIVAQATVVSISPVIVADAPDWNAISPSFVRRARPAARRIFASGLM